MTGKYAKLAECSVTLLARERLMGFTYVIQNVSPEIIFNHLSPSIVE